MVVTGSKDIVGVEREIFVQRHRAIFHIVYVGTYFVHTVCGVHGNNVVHLRLCETAIHEVYCLVASVAEKNAVLRHSLHLSQLFFYLKLQRVWIAV